MTTRGPELDLCLSISSGRTFLGRLSHGAQEDLPFLRRRTFECGECGACLIKPICPFPSVLFASSSVSLSLSQSWKFEDFYQAWQAAVPVVMDVSLDMLEVRKDEVYLSRKRRCCEWLTCGFGLEMPQKDLALITVQSVGGFEEYGATQRVISYLPGEFSGFLILGSVLKT